MKAKDLIGWIRAEPNAEVLIRDQSTGDDLPLGNPLMVYGKPIILRVEGDDSE